MKILAIIPARYASTRLPGKPLADILGKPMIQWVYEAVKNTPEIHEVVVATDDERIRKAVADFGGKVMMTNTSHVNGTSRCAEVAASFPEYDYIINVQGDEPLIDQEHLRKLIQLLKGNTAIATVCSIISDPGSVNDPSRVKVVKSIEGEVLYFSRAPIPYNRDNTEVTYYGHIGLYAFHRDTLKKLSQLAEGQLERAENLEQLRWMEHGYRIHICVIDDPAPSVDTVEGLELVRRLMQEKENKS